MRPQWKKPAHWPEISLDRSRKATRTLRQQIERQLAAAVRTGSLPADCRLPSSRVMAKLLDVSRGTVVDAYEALVAAGVLVASAGSGVNVAPAAPSIPNFSNLRRTAIAAHYPTRVCHLDDWDGTALYLNAVREHPA
jgi:DNA-binding GntR family transcriptional regulator